MGSGIPADMSSSRYQCLTAEKKLISNTLTESDKNFPVPPAGYRGTAVSWTAPACVLFKNIESLTIWRHHRRVCLFLCEA